MNRKEITKFLSNLLVKDKLRGMGKYWASEVSLDYGTMNVRRVDFMQYTPAGVTCISDIEKGVFTCFEVKSCIEDVYSGNGLSFVGEKNYIVTTMECYKQLLVDINTHKFYKHMKEYFPLSSNYFGVIVAIPKGREKQDEFENPTEITFDLDRWKLVTIMNCNIGSRKRAMNELLFYMLRSGHCREAET